MTREQYLFTKLAEEASEVAKIALKTQQFGMGSEHPKKNKDNRTLCHEELTDLVAIVGMLNKETDFGWDPSEEAVLRKEEKVNKYYDICCGLGTVS